MTHLSTWTHQPEERGTIRFLALWLLIEGSEQAVSRGPRIGEDPVQVEGASLWAGSRPPPPARQAAETEIIESMQYMNCILS